MRAITAGLIVGIAILGIAPAKAQNGSRIEARLQAAVSKVQDACAADIKQFCGSVTPGEGRLLLCMQAHEDKISNKCDFALFDASRNLERTLDRIEKVADACWTDIEKNCANVEPGGGNILQCLGKVRDTLKKSCQRVIEKVQAAK